MNRIVTLAAASSVLLGALAVTGGVAAPAAVAAECAPPPAAAVSDRLGIGELHAAGLRGEGIKIGVLSVSYDNHTGTPATTAAEDVASGALPGPGNPCGWEHPVTVISDNVPSDDEGRAMLQIVHAIAPAAELYFATANSTAGPGVSADASTAAAIDSLVDAGVDMIVDDMMYTLDLAFSQGLSAAAAQRASEAGVAYVVAAANLGFVGADEVNATFPASGQHQIASYVTTGFRDATCPDSVIAALTGYEIACHDFDPTPGGVDVTQEYTLRVQSGVSPALLGLVEWGDQPGALTNLVAGFFLDPADGSITDVLEIDDADPELEGQPLAIGEVFGSLAFSGSPSPVFPKRQLVIARDASHVLTEPLPLRFTFWSDNLPRIVQAAQWYSSTETDRFGATIVGRAANLDSITVAARALDPAVGLCPPAEVECFSSTGPQTRYWGPISADGTTPAPALPAPETRVGPTITAYDGVPTTFFSTQIDGEWLFYGTSAATPVTGAVLALGMQARPDASVAELVAALTSSATELIVPWLGVGNQETVGAGFIAPIAFIDALFPTPDPDPTPGGQSAALAASGGQMPIAVAGVGIALAAAGILLVIARRRQA